MLKLTTLRARCSKHKLDKSLTYQDKAPFKLGPYIKQEMAKLGCTDYKVSTRYEQFPNG